MLSSEGRVKGLTMWQAMEEWLGTRDLLEQTRRCITKNAVFRYLKEQGYGWAYINGHDYGFFGISLKDSEDKALTRALDAFLAKLKQSPGRHVASSAMFAAFQEHCVEGGYATSKVHMSRMGWRVALLADRLSKQFRFWYPRGGKGKAWLDVSF